jgi:hypothetical protein
VLAWLCSFALLAGSSGCDFGVHPDQQTLNALENAINEIAQQSQAWQTELPALLNQLQNIGSSLATQVEQIINEASLESSQDALCWTAYAQQIVLQLLNGIKIVNFFENQKPTVTPFVCAIQPNNISVDGIRAGTSTTANLIGFNLYPSKIDSRLTDPMMSAEFVNADQSVVTVPPGLPYIAENGQFTIQLNLTAWNDANPLSDTTAGIQFLANGQRLNQGSVAVIPAKPGPDTVTVSPVANSLFTVGSNVNLQVQATSSSGSPLTYSASGLPPGLVIDSASGAITGVAMTDALHEKIYPVTVTVTDSTGASNSVSFRITVVRQVTCHVVKNVLVCN